MKILMRGRIDADLLERADEVVERAFIAPFKYTSHRTLLRIVRKPAEPGNCDFSKKHCDETYECFVIEETPVNLLPH